ncbi:hypothetical protein RQP54_11350 [Curvibacter sp. APW13]|uniref:hypothetical protein n=1 Tax=Curvibacter sp. APW13 TaxID=3077236 RepID=UPI0028DE6660|nr:hypothetical protein [Curvibacter sp. APW13]MDT8991457.1 hypothetical protein [Curvibacter sp. APW13]
MLLAVLSTDFSHRWFRWGVAFVCALGLLAGCASTAVVEHGIHIEVKGTEPVYDIAVSYGEREIKFADKTAVGSGSLWNAPMRIPDSMTVHWTVHGVRKSVEVSLVGKTADGERLAKWNLVFEAEQLGVWRVDDDPNSKYYFKKPVQVFP